ncbi:hypothetical protein QQF64_006685 [Cirrhinus molitorella]|uniref:Uncharacterized protein n=1 Tax=Cirrhinus molitorella TaxID=172907 RepID=A0ABR3M9A8_9TELE
MRSGFRRQMRSGFRKQMYHRPGSVYNLREFSEWLQYEAWCQSSDAQDSYKGQRMEQKLERRRENKTSCPFSHHPSWSGRHCCKGTC